MRMNSRERLQFLSRLQRVANTFRILLFRLEKHLVMESTSNKPLSAENSTSISSGFESFGLEPEPIDRAAEKRLLRKCDLHVVPVITVLYMLAFIDRINIGNARIQGLENDLRMKGDNYNIALFVFFIPYILFEVPSNLIIRKLSPSTWLSSIMICWGTPNTFHSLCGD